MKLIVPLVLVLSLVGCTIVSTPATTLTPDQPSSSDIASIYVQTGPGVVVFTKDSAGKLTKVKGSPFPVTGQMEAITGKYLISVGTDWLHVYELSSSGAVGKQVSKINTQSYAGGECGTTSELVTDLTGKYIYVELFDYTDDLPSDCTAWQSYSISSSGALTFIGNLEPQVLQDGDHGTIQTFGGAVGSSNHYVYVDGNINNIPSLFPFSMQNGSLNQTTNFKEADPTPDPNLDYFLAPVMAVADSKEHLAVLMMPWFYNDDGSAPENLKLASYTIDPSTGSITSTNTQDDIPFTDLQAPAYTMSMSKNGSFVAIGNNDGMQVFKFNGAKPPTALTKLLLPGTEIDQLAWDKQDHLYALSYAYSMSSNPEGKAELYVYSVGSTVKQVQGSPYSVPGAYGVTGMIVQ